LIESLTVLIAPDRPATKVVVHNRHTGTELRERWDSGKQDVFFQRDIQEGFSIEDIAEQYDATPGEIKESVIRFKMYEAAKQLGLPVDIQEALVDEENFPITTFARLWAFKELRDFMGVSFSATGEIIKLLPIEEFEKRFGFLVTEIVTGNLNSRKINDATEVAKYFESIKSGSLFDLSIPLRVPTAEELAPQDSDNQASENAQNINDSESEDKGDEDKPLPKVKSHASLIGKAEICNTGVEKIDGVFKELQRLDVKSHKHAVSVLLRTFFEITLSEYLDNTGEISNLIAAEQSKFGPEKNGLLKRVSVFIEGLECSKPLHQQGLLNVLTSDANTDKDWSPSLRHMLDYVAREKVKLINPKFKKVIRTYLSGQSGLGHDDFNDFVHNQYMSPKEDALKTFWATFAPLFRSIIRKLDLRPLEQASSQLTNQQPEGPSAQ
jgi:hypothetical protein